MVDILARIMAIISPCPFTNLFFLSVNFFFQSQTANTRTKKVKNVDGISILALKPIDVVKARTSIKLSHSRRSIHKFFSKNLMSNQRAIKKHLDVLRCHFLTAIFLSSLPTAALSKKSRAKSNPTPRNFAPAQKCAKITHKPLGALHNMYSRGVRICGGAACIEC